MQGHAFAVAVEIAGGHFCIWPADPVGAGVA